MNEQYIQMTSHESSSHRQRPCRTRSRSKYPRRSRWACAIIDIQYVHVFAQSNFARHCSLALWLFLLWALYVNAIYLTTKHTVASKRHSGNRDWYIQGILIFALWAFSKKISFGRWPVSWPKLSALRKLRKSQYREKTIRGMGIFFLVHSRTFRILWGAFQSFSLGHACSYVWGHICVYSLLLVWLRSVFTDYLRLLNQHLAWFIIRAKFVQK